MDSDLTFITNEPPHSLLERFTELIPNFTENIDILVGYFYISGFYKLYPSLENVEKIRILVGLGTDSKVYNLTQIGTEQLRLQLNSIKDTKQYYKNKIIDEVSESEDTKIIEDGMLKFVEWLENKKLEIKIYDKAPIHAKLYVLTLKNAPDTGRIITGSSNFTQSGLVDNLEFNVELKNYTDYKFAINKFNELWDGSIDLKETILETVKFKTHLNDNVTPYELYLKFLYEYFKSDLSLSESLEDEDLPESFIDLQYQKQAVINAIKILEEYGGVFISDVVGLGKTYISARLANQLDGRNLVIAPPALLNENNPGSWRNVFYEFGVRHTRFKSIGKLDQIIEEGVEEYKNIFVDESHRFRNEANQTYEKLSQICKGKRVILVSATPFNNAPSDILSQIRLFQNVRKTNIPGLPNLEAFFSRLNGRLTRLDRRDDYNEFMDIIKENAVAIRQKVLRYLMVRRTRDEVKEYYSEDLKKQGFKFPEVAKPEPVYYKFNTEEEKVFNESLEFIKHFKYSRYTPLLYYIGVLTPQVRQSQRNMTIFMKILLLKRFESSIHAFKKTLERFISSYELMIREFDKGNVFVSRKNANKVFQLLEENDEEGILSLIEQEKAEIYESKDFDEKFPIDLRFDLKNLKLIYSRWAEIKRDVKLEKFISILKKDEILISNKLIIFTESFETAQYLGEQLQSALNEKILVFSGSSSSSARDDVIHNFDARSKIKNNEYRILVSTEVLSEGVNLHASNVVINYDIPWNPTRLMQRVGRINRVDTKFDKIYSYNFFPTIETNDELKLKEIAEAKISMFIELLGNDSRLLTDGEEIKSHDLFNKLLSEKTITGEDTEEESELKYLRIIQDIRDNNPDLFVKIKNLSKKARAAKKYSFKNDALLSYFQKGKIDKFILSDYDESKEIGFFDAERILRSDVENKKEKIPESYYSFIKKNKDYFEEIVNIEDLSPIPMSARNNVLKILRRLRSEFIRNFKGFTDEDEEFILKVIENINEGALPKQTTKIVWDKIKSEENPMKVLFSLKKYIPANLLKEPYIKNVKNFEEKRTVILSEYLFSEKK